VSPLRWDVLICGFVLAVPVLLLGLRGDLSADEVATRLLWCLGAGWGAVALIRFASAPRHPATSVHAGDAGGIHPTDPPSEDEPGPS
jgi:hypothetical protein